MNLDVVYRYPIIKERDTEGHHLYGLVLPKDYWDMTPRELPYAHQKKECNSVAERFFCPEDVPEGHYVGAMTLFDDGEIDIEMLEEPKQFDKPEFEFSPTFQ